MRLHDSQEQRHHRRKRGQTEVLALDVEGSSFLTANCCACPCPYQPTVSFLSLLTGFYVHTRGLAEPLGPLQISDIIYQMRGLHSAAIRSPPKVTQPTDKRLSWLTWVAELLYLQSLQSLLWAAHMLLSGLQSPCHTCPTAKEVQGDSRRPSGWYDEISTRAVGKSLNSSRVSRNWPFWTKGTQCPSGFDCSYH